MYTSLTKIFKPWCPFWGWELFGVIVPFHGKQFFLLGFFLGVSGVVDLDDIEYVCDVATDDFRCVVGRGSVEAALTDVFVAILGLVIDDMRLEARRPESVWFAAVSS